MGLGSWYVLGDFNECLAAFEKMGRPSLDISCREFAAAIDDYNLSEIDTLGAVYTWMGRLGSEMM